MYLLIVSTWKKYESISWSNVHPVKVFDYFVFIRSYDGKFINTVGCLKADGWIPFQNKEKIMNFILTEVEKSRYTEINGNSNQFRFNYFSRYSF